MARPTGCRGLKPHRDGKGWGWGDLDSYPPNLRASPSLGTAAPQLVKISAPKFHCKLRRGGRPETCKATDCGGRPRKRGDPSVVWPDGAPRAVKASTCHLNMAQLCCHSFYPQSSLPPVVFLPCSVFTKELQNSSDPAVAEDNIIIRVNLIRHIIFRDLQIALIKYLHQSPLDTQRERWKGFLTATSQSAEESHARHTHGTCPLIY